MWGLSLEDLNVVCHLQVKFVNMVGSVCLAVQHGCELL